MIKYQWIVELDNKRHEIMFAHTNFWGKLTLLLDGEIIQEWKKPLKRKMAY